MKWLMLIAVVLLAVQFVACEDEEKIAELENEKEQLEDQIESLDKDISKLEELVAAVDGDLAELREFPEIQALEEGGSDE